MTIRNKIPFHASRLPDRIDFWSAAVLGVLAFAFYARTLLPGLLPNDGAEFQTLAYTLDHAHTTGYHVYLVLAKLFTWIIPVGDIAYRVNLFSALMGGLTVALTYLAAITLSGSRWGAWLAALALAISATFWSQAIIAEVYTAGSAFSAGIAWMVLAWHETRKPAWLFAAGVLGGAGIGVHGSVMLAAPAVLLLLALNWSDLPRFWKPALVGALVGVAGLVLAFVIVDAREGNSSVMNTYRTSISRWDMQPEQLDSAPERFAFLVFARQWRSAMFVDPSNVIPANLSILIGFINRDFSLVVKLLILLGLASMFYRRGVGGLFILALLTGHMIYTANYRIGDIYVFFVSLYVYIVLLAAEGTAVLQGLFSRLAPHIRQVVLPVFGSMLIVIGVLPFLGPRIDSIQASEIRFDFMNLASNDDLQDWRDLIRGNTSALPENAIVLAGWDNLYGYIYTAEVELDRTDLLLIEAYPYATKPGIASTLVEFLRTEIGRGRQVYALQRYDELNGLGFQLKGRPVGYTEMYQVELP